jgi:hypothetical protein
LFPYESIPENQTQKFAFSVNDEKHIVLVVREKRPAIRDRRIGFDSRCPGVQYVSGGKVLNIPPPADHLPADGALGDDTDRYPVNLAVNHDGEPLAGLLY